MTRLIEDYYWVGYVDWSLRNFHSYEIPDGATYNCYLVMDEQPTLIDTVKEPYNQEFFDKISRVPGCDISKVQNIVCLHAEPDHSGSLQHSYLRNPSVRIYCSQKCVAMIHQYYSFIPDSAIHVVADNDVLKIGRRTLVFKMTPFQHWPEQMMCYCPEDMVLFSSDTFGQHIASTQRWADEFDINRIVMRMEDYFANILNPFAKSIAKNSRFVFDMQFKYLFTAHGLCFRGRHVQTAYGVYSDILAHKHKQNKVLILYNSMYGSTQQAAQRISQGISSRGFKPVLCNLDTTAVAECALQMFQSRALCVGSPTLNGMMMPNVQAALMYLKALQLLKGVPVVIFGAYCWNPAAIDDIAHSVDGTCVIHKRLSWQLRLDSEVEQKLIEAGCSVTDLAGRDDRGTTEENPEGDTATHN